MKNEDFFGIFGGIAYKEEKLKKRGGSKIYLGWFKEKVQPYITLKPRKVFEKEQIGVHHGINKKVPTPTLRY